MAKIGINIKIDVSKIDKSRIFKGEKGSYLDLTTFLDTTNPGQYGDHGFISQATTKEEREAGVKTPILGNCKVFYSDMDSSLKAQSSAPQANHQQTNMGHNVDENFDNMDIPF